MLCLLLSLSFAFALGECPKSTYWQNKQCFGTDLTDQRNQVYSAVAPLMKGSVVKVDSSCCNCPAKPLLDGEGGCYFRRAWSGKRVALPMSCCAAEHLEADPVVINPDPVRDAYKAETGAAFLSAIPPPPVPAEARPYSSRRLLQFEGPSCAAPNGVKGVCMESSRCPGTTVSRLCRGPASIKCCITASDSSSDSASDSAPAVPQPPPRQSAELADPSVDRFDGPVARTGLCPNFYRVWNAYPPLAVDDNDLRSETGFGTWVTNTCTVRFSLAMKGIGYRPGEVGDSKWIGKGNRYLIRVQEGIRFAEALFGPAVGGKPRETDRDSPNPNSPGINGKDFLPPAEIMGRPGVIWFSDCIFSDATGHLDVWDGYNIREAAYFHRCRRAAVFDVCNMKSNPDFSKFKQYMITSDAYKRRS